MYVYMLIDSCTVLAADGYADTLELANSLTQC